VSLGSALRMHSPVQGSVDSGQYHEADKRYIRFKFFSKLLFYLSYVCLHCLRLCVNKHIRMHC
jgi:hypothetical protein